MPSCKRPPEIQVGGPRILCHIERVLVAHVDHGGADFDPAGPCTNGGKQRERRRKLVGEVMNPEIRAVGTSSSAAIARSMDLQEASDAERVRDAAKAPVTERQNQCLNDHETISGTNCSLHLMA